MPTSDDSIPYRHDAHAAYERIAALEEELARLRGALQSPQARALASLRIDHVREDRADLVARFRRRRSVLFVATGLGMSLAFAYFLVRAGLAPASARDLWIACGAAVTAVAGSGWLAQALLHGSALTQCRRLDRRIAEEQVLAGIEPSLPEPSRVRVATDRIDVTPIDAEPTLADPRARAAAR